MANTLNQYDARRVFSQCKIDYKAQSWETFELLDMCLGSLDAPEEIPCGSHARFGSVYQYTVPTFVYRDC